LGKRTRIYRRLHQSSSLAFLTEICRAFPFRIRELQCDNGQDFPLPSRLPCKIGEFGIATSSRAAHNVHVDRR
jgi:hypothetical protein